MSINSSALTDTASLQFLSVTVDDILLADEDLLTIDVTWDKNVFEVKGTLIIRDNLDLVNSLQPNGFNYITIYSVDMFNSFWERKFVITDIVESREREKFKLLTLSFQDELSFEMMNTYISKSYSNKKLSSIIEDFWSYYKFDERFITPFENTGLSKDFSMTTIVHDFITVPQDRSFYDFITQELKNENFTLYQTRDMITLSDKTTLYPSALETFEYDLSQTHPRPEYAFKIHDIDNEYNPILNQNKVSPLGNISYFNFNSKTIGEDKVVLGDVYSDIKLNTFDMSTSQRTIGEKYHTGTTRNNDVVVQEMRALYGKNAVLDVVLSGNFKYNKYYQNYNVVLIGNLEHMQGQIEGDIVTGGLYTCYAIIDRYVGQKLIQKMRLSRADFTERV